VAVRSPANVYAGRGPRDGRVTRKFALAASPAGQAAALESSCYSHDDKRFRLVVNVFFSTIS
jgi:hypothetical protein